jgi:integrase
MARGSVIARGEKTWRVIVELPPDPITGKRQQKFETVKGSKKDADKRLTELLALVDQNRLDVSPKLTLGQFLDRWLHDYAASLAPSTYKRYEQLVKNQIVPHVGNVQLRKVAPSNLVRLFSTLRDSQRLDGRGKLSSQSQMHTYRMLHTALECARKWRYIPVNPMMDVDAPKVTRSEMRTFTVEQAQSFLFAAGSEALKWQMFFWLALTGGLRSGELRGLRWQDVDLTASTLRVQQSISRIVGVGRVTRQPKTAGSRRPIALGDDVMTLLRCHKAEQNVERLALGPLWQDHNLVFPSEVGTPLEDKRIREVFFRICDRAGVPHIRPYDLRHSCASLILGAGFNLKVVSERLGHSSTSLTLSTYSHVSPTMQREAANALETLLRAKS